MFVLLFSQYCTNDRAVPTYMSASISGSCLSQADADSQASCISSQSYNQQSMENSNTGSVYYVPCGLYGSPSSAWETPTYQDGPPCEVGVWPCSVTTFSLFGYTMQEYCTGEYTNSEQYPFHAPPTSSTNCMPISACGSSQKITFMLQTGTTDPTNPANYFVFLYNCGNTAVPGYTATNLTCSSFPEYQKKATGPNGPPPPKQAKPAVSGGGIAGIVIAGVVLIAGAAVAMVPPLRQAVLASGNHLIAMVKGTSTPA